MPYRVPKTLELTNEYRAEIEKKLGVVTPLSEKAYNNVLTAAEAMQHRGLYEYANDLTRECFALTATEEGLELIGREYGLYRKKPSAWEGEGEIELEEGLSMKAGTVYVSNSGGKYETKETIYNDNSEKSKKTVKLKSVTEGIAGNLALNSRLKLETNVEGAGREAIITRVLKIGTAKEDTETYRRRILDAERSEGGGGNACDYRDWAQQVPGVRRAYPFTGVPEGSETNTFKLTTVKNVWAYYPCEEINAGLLKDQSGNGRDLTLNGSVTIDEAVKGKGLHFHTGGYLDGVNTAAFNEFTWAFWLKRGIFNGVQSIINIRNAAGADLAVPADETLRYRAYVNGAYVQGNINIPENEWVHVIYKYKAAEKKVYIKINNNLVEERDLNGVITWKDANNNVLFIGENQTETSKTGTLNSSLDEIYLFSRFTSDMEDEYISSKPSKAPERKALPGDRTVYIECNHDLDEEGIPPEELLAAVKAALIKNPDTGKTRELLGMPKEMLYVEPIRRRRLYVNLIGLIKEGERGEALRASKEAVRSFIDTYEPYVEGVDAENERRDMLSSSVLIREVQNILDEFQATVQDVTFGLDGGTYVRRYDLKSNEKLLLSSFQIDGIEV